MSKINELDKLFEEWNGLNLKVQGSFSDFDFSKIKEIRIKQKKIEDLIFQILIENAPESYQTLLPEDAGQMEVGYDIEGKTFYFVMIDPKTQDDSIKLIAFTIDTSKNVNLVEDFKIED